MMNLAVMGKEKKYDRDPEDLIRLLELLMQRFLYSQTQFH